MPGAGKSTWARAEVRRLEASGAIALAFDPAYGFRGRDVKRYRTPEELLASVKRDPNGIHCLDTGNGFRVLEVALEVAKLGKGTAGEGELARPTVVYFDEVAGVGGMSAKSIHPMMEEAYVMRRHYHLGFVCNTQRPPMIHPTFWDLRDRLISFRIESKRVLRLLDEHGLPEDVLARIRALPDFAFVAYPR